MLRPVPANTGTITPGVPQTIAIGTEGENATRTFSGTAGQLYTLEVTGSTIASADVRVYRSGFTATSATVSPPGRWYDTFHAH